MCTEHLQLWDTAPVYILDQLTCVVNIPPIVTVNLQLHREAETGASHSASNIYHVSLKVLLHAPSYIPHCINLY